MKMELLTKKECLGCDKSIPLGSNSNAKYCSTKCRHKLYYKFYYQKHKRILLERSKRWMKENRKRYNEYRKMNNRKIGIVKSSE